MDYERARLNEIHDAHQRVIERFVSTYRCGRPTILLLPGGMGSQLDRTTKPYVNARSVPFGTYDPVWMDPGIIFGRDAEYIRIQDNDHDADEFIIVPNGPLHFLVNAYDGTQRFFKELGWNYVVFGYDWRRSVSEAAEQLENFLGLLRDRVKARRGENPLPTTTLLGHSQGGLVAKVFLQRIVAGTNGRKLGDWCARFVSVGAPFYGTATHQQRYYQGQSPLNTLYGVENVAKIAASLPGPYILMHADRATLERDGRTLGLRGGYPVTDADTGAPVDPYAPANFARYPQWVPTAHLDAARDERETLTAELPDAAVARVFHLRSNLTLTGGERIIWRAVDGAAYDPGAGNPLQLVEGPGDGTVPFWSARLAQTPSTQIFNLRMAGDHGSLAEHEETLRVLESLMNNGKLPRTVAARAQDRTLGVPKASEAETRRFVEGVKAGEIKKNDPLASQPDIWRRLLEETHLA